MARDAFDSVGVGIVGGTLGVGITVTTPINDVLNARGMIAGLSLDHEFEGQADNGTAVTFDGELTLFNVGALLDYHPWAGGFRVSAGLFYTGNKLEGVGSCSKNCSITIGNAIAGIPITSTSYQLNEGDRVHAEVDYSGVAPYLGIGWGNAVDTAGRFSFSFDLGVMYTGEPDVSVTCDVSTSAPPGAQGQCQEAADREAEDVRDEIGDYEFYPVLMLGAAYRF